MARATATAGPRLGKQDAELLALYADMMSHSVRETGDVRAGLAASTRADMAGAPLNDLLLPYTYQQKVMKVWEGFSTDPLFGRLVNRTVEFAANGAQWELPTDERTGSWLEVVRKWTTFGKDYDRQSQFWQTWSESINDGVADVLPGMDFVSEWMVKHMLLSGMFVPAIKLGTMKFGKQDFIVPTQITCYSAASVAIARSRELFGKEVIYLRLPPGMNSIPLREGEQNIAQEYLPFIPRNSLNLYQELMPLKDIRSPEQTAAWAVKFKWSPGDIAITRGARLAHAGSGVYPLLPFYSLLPQFATRQKLFASDLALLDGVINFIMMYKIGDADHPPMAPKYKTVAGVKTLEFEGTIAMCKRLIQEGRIGPAMELFVPYYVDLVMKMPDTTVLLNESKYFQSSIEIMQAFGILFSRGTGGARDRLEKMNIANFEELLGSIRIYVRAFWMQLARFIVRINGNKLKITPNWTPNPLNTKSDAFNTALLELAKIGRVSFRTLLRYHGINDAVELARIASEQGTDVDDMLDEQVPVSYVQTMTQPDAHSDDPADDDDPPATETTKSQPQPSGTDKTVSITPGKQQGRPKNSARGRGKVNQRGGKKKK